MIFSSVRPTDGAEIVAYGHKPHSSGERTPQTKIQRFHIDRAVKFVDAASNTEFKILSSRTDRTEPFDLEITNLSNPVVIEFINASAQNRLVDFVSRFGFLNPHEDRWPNSRENASLVDTLHAEARMLHAQLLAALPDDVSERVKLIDEALKSAPLNASYRLFGPEGRGQLVVRVKSLRGFMTMEIALAHEAGAEPRECQHCGKVFLVGPLTGRRASSLFCSNSCRVMAHRARKKEEEGSNVGS